MSLRTLEQANYLYENKFLFQVDRIKNFNFYVQTANIPGITIGHAEIKTPLSALKEPFRGIKFEPLSISFLVQENIANYLELHSWCYGLSIPTSAQQYKDLKDGTGSLLSSPASRGHTVSDATLLILSSNNNATHKVSYKNAFPKSISSVDFSDTSEHPKPVTCTVTFEYEYYTIEAV